MIEFRDVTKRFQRAKKGSLAAVDQFTHTIDSRTIHVLLGSSGCGKTTLLRMVNRMESPTSGQILIDGEDVAETDPVQLRRSIGYVMQASGLLPHRTVLDNVTTVLRLQGKSKKESHARGMEMLELVGLSPEMANRYPGQLSGGQAQRVGVARALAPNPNIVLMDEPFAAVDPVVRRQLQELVLDLQEELETTILFVTHDVDEALRMSDEVVLLTQGAQIQQHGTPSDLLVKPANEFVEQFLGVRASRDLYLDDQNIVIDSSGRPLGSLSGNPANAAGAGVPGVGVPGVGEGANK
ncbi:MAG TPA: ATP-binding cassette domain-containing protein [Actinomyces sp.]|nr:ATP-binding cassette domain-containing protein [Actinomyces sp.]